MYLVTRVLNKFVFYKILIYYTSVTDRELQKEAIPNTELVMYKNFKFVKNRQIFRKCTIYHKHCILYFVI